MQLYAIIVCNYVQVMQFRDVQLRVNGGEVCPCTAHQAMSPKKNSPGVENILAHLCTAPGNRPCRKTSQ